MKRRRMERSCGAQQSCIEGHVLVVVGSSEKPRQIHWVWHQKCIPVSLLRFRSLFVRVCVMVLSFGFVSLSFYVVIAFLILFAFGGYCFNVFCVVARLALLSDACQFCLHFVCGCFRWARHALLSDACHVLFAYCSDAGCFRWARLDLLSDACQLRLHIARPRGVFIGHGCGVMCLNASRTTASAPAFLFSD